METPILFALVAAGVLAGLIDSIAGGGGLITVPIFSLLLGPGSTAIGTNKIVAVAASLAALLVYMRGGHVSIRGNRIFALIVGASSALGALLSPLIPPEAYRWLLVAICPVILWIVFRKDLWIKRSIDEGASVPFAPKRSLLWLAGFACGFYDGIAGPGGGTLMFLSLFTVARLPLLASIATAKVANLASASVSLASYAATGHVKWASGVPMAIGISVGAMIGASFASREVGSLARGALLVVGSLLILRLIFM